MGPQGPPGSDTLANLSQLASAVVSLRAYLTALVPVTPFHVKSHSGVLENELVDQVAKAAARSPEDVYESCLPSVLACEILCAPTSSVGLAVAGPLRGFACSFCHAL